MSRSKLTPDLASRAQNASPEEFLDIVIELVPAALATAPSASGSPAAISVMKAAFQRESAPIEDALRLAGGQLLGCVWLNHTLRARIPARSVEQLAELASVRIVDIPHPIKADVR